MKECMKRKTCDKVFRRGECACANCKDLVEPGADADGDEETEETEETEEVDDGEEAETFEDDDFNEGSALVEVPVEVKRTLETTYLVKVTVAADNLDDAVERACSVVDAMDADDVVEKGEVVHEDPDWGSADADSDDDDIRIVKGRLEE